MPSMQHQVDNKKTMLLQKAKKIPASTQSDLKAVDISYSPITTPTADLHNEQHQKQDESPVGIVLQIYLVLFMRL